MLSSWLIRTAEANGVKAHTFTSFYWPNLAVWNRDIDSSAPEWFVEDLARRSGAGVADVEATLLSSLAGVLFERYHPNEFTPLVLPVGMYHRRRLRHGMQYCPDCLSQRLPYYRRSWRLAIAVLCLEHRRPLRDACPRCSAAVNFHRADLDDRDRAIAAILTSCSSCGADLRSDDVDAEPTATEVAIVAECQTVMMGVIRGEGAQLGGRALHPIPYFAIVRHLMQLITSRSSAAALRAALLGRETNFTWTSRIHALEYLRSADRFTVLLAFAHLTRDWPSNLIRIGRELGLTASDLLHGHTLVPFALAEVIEEHFSMRAYVPAIEEIRAAIAYLRRRGLPVTKTSVSRLLGQSDVLRKRNLRYLLDEDDVSLSRDARRLIP